MPFTKFCIYLAHRVIWWASANIKWPLQLKIYHCRNTLKALKDHADNAVFLVFEHTVLHLPNGGLKVSLLVGIWLVGKVLPIALFALLVIFRPLAM